MISKSQNVPTAHEINDDELNHVSGGDGNLVHVVATTVMNMITEKLIQEAYPASSK